MGFGLGVLRLPPAAFWAMTLQEIDAAAQGLVGATPTSGPPGRGDLEGLMRLFPDVPPRSGAPAS